jgi:hypothetical protein
MTSYDGSFHGHDHDADSVVYDTRVNNRNAESTAQRRARVMSVMLSVQNLSAMPIGDCGWNEFLKWSEVNE